MAQGILSGIALGAVFSVSAAAVVSIIVPMQPQPAPQLGEAEQIAPAAPAMTEPAVRVTTDEVPPAPQPQVALRAPVSEALPTEPTAPAALPQPQTGTAADLTTPRPLPQALTARIAEDAPVLPNPQALAPMIPDDSQDAQVADEDPVAPAPAIAVTDAENEGEETFIVVEPAPQADPAPQTDIATEAGTEITAEAEQEVPAQEQAQAQPEQDTRTEVEPQTIIAAAPKPRVRAVPGTPRTTLGSDQRLSIGRPANSLINPDAGASEGDNVVSQASVNSAQTAPIRDFAQPFENAQGKPLMSIVLMDTGVDLDAAAIGLPALSSFPYPVSFAVDASLSDATDRMARYRNEGFDVLAMVDLPLAAQPTDAEVSLSVALNTMPEVVGVLEGTGEGLQGSREVADQVTRILKASGHGLVAQSKGLNSMPKLAVKEGVPAAPVFRDFDSAGQTPRVIRRFLDQAAFKAGQEGGVIMLGRLRPETIEALLVWGLADRAGSVALAPVSAVLLSK